MLGVPAVRRTVEPRHDRLVAAIGYIVHQATIATVEIERFQNAEVAVILDVTARIAGSLVKVDDTGIQAMSRIEFAEHCAMQALIVSHTSEFHTPEHRAFPFGDLNSPHATPRIHDALRREPVMGDDPVAII